MADSSQAVRTGLQIFLALVIVVLAYWLYLSITEPYKVIEQERELTELTRQRMSDVRSALIAHEQRVGRFPGSLDSLVYFVRDSLSEGRRDSLLSAQYPADSLIYSPRTRSEERRVGKECRSRCAPDHSKRKRERAEERI